MVVDSNPFVQAICFYVKRIFGTLKRACIISGIIFGALSLVLYASVQDSTRVEPMVATWMAYLFIIANLALVYGTLMEKADFLWGYLAAAALIAPLLPILVIVSLIDHTWRWYPTLPAIVGQPILVVLLLQMAIAYGHLLELDESGASEMNSKDLGLSHKNNINMPKPQLNGSESPVVSVNGRSC